MRVSIRVMSYGADFIEQYRRAAGYVDRILKGGRTVDPETIRDYFQKTESTCRRLTETDETCLRLRFGELSPA